MKTGLLTFYHIHHYGAMLQAYATERAVASLGSECEIIDYYVNQDNTCSSGPLAWEAPPMTPTPPCTMARCRPDTSGLRHFPGRI